MRSSSTDASTRPLAGATEGAEAADLDDDVVVGSTIDGRYQVVRRLGVGGMGAVYEAEHLRLGTRIAVKILQPSFSSNDKYRKRFLREAKAASAIDSNHIVRASDFGTTNRGLLYFTMELLEGEDLEQFLQQRSHVSWQQLEPLFFQILVAVRAAHARGVIHRDIKPSNCFLCYDTNDAPLVKVLDFGIAKFNATSADGNNSVATVEALTATNELFGTVAYMAPELIEGNVADARSDIYALGVMLFRCLTGALPFTGANAYKVFQHHVGTPVPSLRERQASVPAAVESVVFRAMAKRPEHRYQRVEELEAALIAASRGVMEPSAAGLSGHTEAVISVPAPRTDPSLSGQSSLSARVITQPVDDPGSLRGVPPAWSRASMLGVFGLVLLISGGTAAVVGTMMSSAPAEPITERAALSLPEQSTEPAPIETQKPESSLPAVAETTVEPTPPAPPDESNADAAATGTGTSEPEPEVPAAVPPKQRPRRVKSTPVAPPAKSIGELAGERCPDAIGDEFAINGLVGSDGRYIDPEIRGGSKPARDCIRSFILRRRFERSQALREQTMKLTPR
ncbi:MAG: protein kinase [Nannocystaceae bacterium]